MRVEYTIIEHDGGWAYKAGGVISETFSSHAAARAAVERVAREQRVPGEAVEISYQDAKGATHVEHVEGGDRPSTSVVDSTGHAVGDLSAANDK